jgi:outer membrane protein assembly factor BamE (lipoprotein component of BamABCDE complex)
MRREHFFLCLHLKLFFLSLLIFCLLLAGCSASLHTRVKNKNYKIGEQNKHLINKIEKGMSLSEVNKLMGSGQIKVQEGWVRWYETNVDQPFRIRYIRLGEQKYMIYYYWTKTKKSEEFLTPVIFRDNKVATVGWENEKISEEKLRRESWGDPSKDN